MRKDEYIAELKHRLAGFSASDMGMRFRIVKNILRKQEKGKSSRS